MHEPSYLSQQELEVFFRMISPTIKIKVLQWMYKQILSEMIFFKDNYNVIDDLLWKIRSINFLPEE